MQGIFQAWNRDPVPKQDFCGYTVAKELQRLQLPELSELQPQMDTNIA